MFKPLPQGQLGDAPILLGETYTIKVTRVTLVEQDSKDYSKNAPYPIIRSVDEIKDEIYMLETDTRPAFTKL